MKFRPVFVLLVVGCLLVVLGLISRWAGFGSPSILSRETTAAPEDDLRKGRSLLDASDQKRLRKDFTEAKKCYEDAVSAFQTAGAGRFATAARQMAEMCAAMPLNMSKLKSGTYEGTDRGYVADITVRLEVKSGRVKQSQIVSHAESRPRNSLDIVPQRILTRQSPSVDAVTGATITSCAVMSATFKALEKAK
jgi:uncharacterized protein with FMN-binding domain